MKATPPGPALPSLRVLTLRCPHCAASLVAASESLRCDGCARSFRIHAGIPDLRVFPDPYLSEQEDGERTEKVLEALDRLSLPELLRYYWSLSDITPPHLRKQFTESALAGEEKARRLLSLLATGFRRPVEARRVLEIGSGTGGFLAVASSQFEEVVGVDVAMRWLHLSRRRFRDLGIAAPPLVCCGGESLPFPDARFDLVVLTATLEFTRDPARVLAEAGRVLAPGGALFLNTVNRYSIAPEPHVNLWGVGFLPRPWQDPYVRWRRHVSFKNIRPLSYRELRHLASPHFASCEVLLADIPDAVLAGLPQTKRAQVRFYRFLKRLPPFALFLRWFGPEWDVKLQRAP